MVVVLAVLAAGGYYGWRYFQSWRAAHPSILAPATPEADESAKSAGAEKGVSKTVKTNRGGTGAATASAPPAHKTLTYEQQARVKELNSYAAMYLRQGGCEKAMPVYQQVIDIDPGDPTAWKGMQDCYAKTKKSQPLPAPPPPPVTEP
jgi:hypothetical protein